MYWIQIVDVCQRQPVAQHWSTLGKDSLRPNMGANCASFSLNTIRGRRWPSLKRQMPFKRRKWLRCDGLPFLSKSP